MFFEGKIWKDNKHWLVEVPGLDVMTQGRTKQEALDLIKDAIETLVGEPGFWIDISDITPQNTFSITSEETARLLSLALQRLRSKGGMTVREASKRMGSNSPNAFGRYEQGDATPSIEKLEELLAAIDSPVRITIKAG